MKLIYLLLLHLIMGVAFGITIKDNPNGVVFYTPIFILIIFIINLWYYTGKTWKQIYCPLCDSDNIRLSTISKVNKEYCVRLYCDGCEKAMTLTGNLVSTRGKVEK